MYTIPRTAVAWTVYLDVLAQYRVLKTRLDSDLKISSLEVRQEALDFIHYLREKLVGENRSTEYIINMDQTPVFFDMPSGRALSPQGTLVFCHASSYFHFTNLSLFFSSGARTTNGRTSTSQTLRCTVAVTVSASGKMLKPARPEAVC